MVSYFSLQLIFEELHLLNCGVVSKRIFILSEMTIKMLHFPALKKRKGNQKESGMKIKGNPFLVFESQELNLLAW